MEEVHCAGGFQNVQHKQSLGRSRHADSNAFTPKLRKHCNRVVAFVENEYRRIEYPTERVEDVLVGRLGNTESRERGLHPGCRVTQQIEILDCPTRVADLELDTMASQDPAISFRNVLVPGSRHSGSDYEVTRRQWIDQAIGDV